jgi:hypothetical protein
MSDTKLSTLLDAFSHFLTVTGDFLHLVDIELDLDDPTHPCHAAADMLEDAIEDARRAFDDYREKQ